MLTLVIQAIKGRNRVIFSIRNFMKTLKKVAVFLPIVALLAMPVFVGAQSNNIGTQPVTSPVQGMSTLQQTIDRIVGFLQTLLFALAAVFIVIAGYKYLTAQGDSEKVDSAKNMLLYALIAIVLAIVATGIVALVRNVLGA